MQAGAIQRLRPATAAAALLSLALTSPAQGPDSDAPMEEVIVIGESRTLLLRQIQIATEIVFDRFNEINSDDDFDVHCRDERRLGSKITRRVCRPNFRLTADARSARAFLADLQGGVGQQAWTFQAEAMARQREMADEMRRLVNEDEQFRAAAARVAELERALEARDDSERQRQRGKTSARFASSADAALPYDAALMAEVQMGRNAWEHALTRRTFGIAHLYGEIDSLGVRCGRERASFEYELAAEWTLPDDWHQCRLTVRAPRGTAFTLFEFE